jgi:mannosyltransferase OCH1-like enzyme
MLSGELPFRQLEAHRPGLGFPMDSAPSIPANVWSTWITTRFGRSHANGIREFRERNPEYSFHIFSDAECDSFMDEHFGGHPILDVYRRGRFGPLRADIWRYAVLFIHGGWYFDIKSCLTVPLRTFAPTDATAVIAYEPPDNRVPEEYQVGHLRFPSKQAVNWGIGFVAGHPVLEHLLDDIAEELHSTGRDIVEWPMPRIVFVSGPVRLSIALHRWTRAERPRGLHECDVNFGAAGCYEISGSWTRLLLQPHYKYRFNEPLLDPA